MLAKRIIQAKIVRAVAYRYWQGFAVASHRVSNVSRYSILFVILLHGIIPNFPEAAFFEAKSHGIDSSIFKNRKERQKRKRKKKRKKRKKSKSEHLESIAIVRDSRCSRGDGTNRVIGHALATRATDKAPTRPIIGEFRTIGYHMYLSLRCVNACVTHTRTSSMFPLRVFCTKDNDTHEDRRRVAKLHEILL